MNTSSWDCTQTTDHMTEMLQQRSRCSDRLGGLEDGLSNEGVISDSPSSDTETENETARDKRVRKRKENKGEMDMHNASQNFFNFTDNFLCNY